MSGQTGLERKGEADSEKIYSDQQKVSAHSHLCGEENEDGFLFHAGNVHIKFPVKFNNRRCPKAFSSLYRSANTQTFPRTEQIGRPVKFHSVAARGIYVKLAAAFDDIRVSLAFPGYVDKFHSFHLIR